MKMKSPFTFDLPTRIVFGYNAKDQLPKIMQNDFAFICTLSEPASITITAWNSLGQPITRETTYGAEGQNQIIMKNTGNLATGVYFLHTEVHGNINTAKFLFVR